jgi:hypothetical protein
MKQIVAAWSIACALLCACGDDGTEGLSSCPGAKITSDSSGLLRCAPPESRAGSGGKGGAAAANAGSKSTGSNIQASTATPPPTASSAGAPAAMSGSAAPANAAGAQSSANATPAGPPTNTLWMCLDIGGVCSCSPNSSPQFADDTCPKPHPPCCSWVPAQNVCICTPDASSQCNAMRGDAARYMSVASCPP